MAKFAWDSYVQHAWGENELKPISRRGHSASIFGNTAMGATIVDSLDTLFIMNLTDEYKKARDWVAVALNFDSVRSLLLILIPAFGIYCSVYIVIVKIYCNGYFYSLFTKSYYLCISI